MKQLRIIARPSKIDDIMQTLPKADVGGSTFSNVRREGREEPPLVGDTYSLEQVLVAVDDKKVKEVFDKVSNVARIGQKGDVRIFVTDVVDALDVCTKKTGNEIISQ